MINWNALLLGGASLVEASCYESFAPHLEEDARVLHGLLEGMDALEAQYGAAVNAAQATKRGYFTPDEDDRVRQMLLSYRNFRLATFSAVWRYAHYPRETDPLVQLKGFIVGYAAALMMFSKSLKFVQVCDPHEIVRKKLNEPDERFGIGTGFFDNVVETYCSFRYLILFAVGDRFWRRNSALIRRFELEKDPVVGEFVAHIRTLRVRCWRLFWPTIRKRLHYERRSTLRFLFAPLRITGWGAQTLLGHAVARMRTTLDYQPAVDDAALDYLVARIRPGDLLFTRTEHKATTALLPGFFGHVAIYFGQPADLERAGISDQPAIKRAVETMCGINAPRGWVLEARHSGVVVQPLELALPCDHVLALRPNQSESEVWARLAAAFEHFGKPYDFDFDFGRSSHIVCSELVYRSMHNMGPFRFSLTKRMGRYTLTVDDIVQQYLKDKETLPDAWSAIAFLLRWQRNRALPTDPLHVSTILSALLPGK